MPQTFTDFRGITDKNHNLFFYCLMSVAHLVKQSDLHLVRFLLVRESVQQDYSRTFKDFQEHSMTYADSKMSARVSRTFKDSFAFIFYRLSNEGYWSFLATWPCWSTYQVGHMPIIIKCYFKSVQHLYHYKYIQQQQSLKHTELEIFV